MKRSLTKFEMVKFYCIIDRGNYIRDVPSNREYDL
jgi:hypothetical protein